MDDEHKSEEDDEYIEPTCEENDKIKSKISKGIIEEDVRDSISVKKSSPKVIKAVLFTIKNHEKDILAVSYQNKTVQTKDKWNNSNLMHIQYLLGTNNCLPLSHMAKSYI